MFFKSKPCTRLDRAYYLFWWNLFLVGGEPTLSTIWLLACMRQDNIYFHEAHQRVSGLPSRRIYYSQVISLKDVIWQIVRGSPKMSLHLLRFAWISRQRWPLDSKNWRVAVVSSGLALKRRLCVKREGWGNKDTALFRKDVFRNLEETKVQYICWSAVQGTLSP